VENKEERKTETRQGRNPGISKSRRKTFQLTAANSLIIYVAITIQQTGTISQRHRESVLGGSLIKGNKKPE
jgi:hypothetical protein